MNDESTINKNFNLAILGNKIVGEITKEWSEAFDDYFNLEWVNNNWDSLKDYLGSNSPDVLLVYVEQAKNISEFQNEIAKLSSTIVVVILSYALADQKGALEHIDSIRKVYIEPIDNHEMVMKTAYNAANTELYLTKTASAATANHNAGNRHQALSVGTTSIAFVSANGGSGKSTIAEGLATELQARRNINTLLFSFNNPSTIFSRFRSATTKRALSRTRNAQEYFDRPSSGFKESIQETVEGIKVIVAPQSSLGYDIATKLAPNDPSSIANLVNTSYREGYGAILMDLPPGETAWTIDSMVNAQQIIIVAHPTLDSIFNILYIANILINEMPDGQKTDRNSIMVVLNEVSKHSQYNATTFFKAGKTYSETSNMPLQGIGGWFPPVIASIPYDPNITKAQDNTQTAINMSEPFGKAIKQLADNFFPSSATQKVKSKKTGFFGKTVFKVSKTVD